MVQKLSFFILCTLKDIFFKTSFKYILFHVYIGNVFTNCSKILQDAYDLLLKFKFPIDVDEVIMVKNLENLFTALRLKAVCILLLFGLIFKAT